MAAPPVNTPQIEKIFKDSTWQAQAERPDILGQLGSKWNEFLAGKGQGLKAYVDDLQLAHNSILKFFQVDITGMFRMTSSARYFKEGVGSSRPN